MGAMTAPMCGAFFLLVVSGRELALYMSTAVIGVCTGAITSISVSATTELFGEKNFGVNHNILVSNIPMGSFLFGDLAALLYRRRGGENCMGEKCYQTTFIIWGFFCHRSPPPAFVSDNHHHHHHQSPHPPATLRLKTHPHPRRHVPPHGVSACDSPTLPASSPTTLLMASSSTAGPSSNIGHPDQQQNISPDATTVIPETIKCPKPADPPLRHQLLLR
ncbi:protein NUCLEAR FUSION defective [Sesamum alatum]|uniref:Protein NUCLEAR FUSION defective n=1 Tax=Sesamum alatum TaxID=300844 RepID=A0AAE2C812_9LAMI|nr:protein NUCLEAR FUSION defective [Sesamum alatum]